VKKILVIEDETELRQSIAEMLHYEGFEIFEAADGEQGLMLMQQKKPDIILCDIRMPLMNGYDLLEKFRQKELFQRIPFIYLTALTERTKFRQGMELGADDFLTKPFTREELTRAITAQLEKYKTKENYIQKKIEEIEKKLDHKLSDVQNEYEIQKKSIEEMAKQNKHLNHRLKEKEIEVTEEALRAIETSNTIQNMKKMINEALHKSDLTTRQTKLLTELKKKINEKKFLVNNWTIFQLRFNQAYPNFIAQFIQKFENITQYELVFISATRMGLSTYQLSDLLNISPESVRKSRYRLKKKLGLQKEDDFLQFILSLNF
jgi:DNA-binding response OmpR family regulator/DNA-binding CsgD family transcriptional regulator